MAEIIKSLRETMGDVEKKVKDTHKQWNTKIREQLRDRTGFSPTIGEKRQFIPVYIIPGIPVSFRKIFNQYPDPFFWNVFIRKGELETTRKGLIYILQNTGEVELIQYGGNAERLGYVDETLNTVDHLLNFANQVNLVDLIKGMGDVFGCYYPGNPTIELNWISIGLFAGVMKVSVESLTMVVLAHELAHAYTHVGMDFDGNQWGTMQFECSDLAVIEGLAQYYTERIAQVWVSNSPEMLHTFYELLKHQSDEYTRYKKWTGRDGISDELIRQCMRSCRRYGIADFEFFEDQLEIGRKKPEKKVRSKNYFQDRMLDNGVESESRE